MVITKIFPTRTSNRESAHPPLLEPVGIRCVVSHRGSVGGLGQPAGSSSIFSKKGFTLLEILIVLAIMAALITFSAGRIRKQDNNIKSVARKFLVLVKEVRNRARLQNVTYRIVIQMDPKGPHRYWVERSNGVELVDPKEILQPPSKGLFTDEKEKKPPPFQMDKSLLKKEQELPSGFYFASVDILGFETPFTEGPAFIHFFPEGTVQTAAIQVTNGKSLTWTLVINPITGQTEIVPKAVTLKDLQR